MDLLIRRESWSAKLSLEGVLPLDWIAAHLRKIESTRGGGGSVCVHSQDGDVYRRSSHECWNYFMCIWLQYLLLFFPLSWRICRNAPHRSAHSVSMWPLSCSDRGSAARRLESVCNPHGNPPSSPPCPIWLSHGSRLSSKKSKSLAKLFKGLEKKKLDGSREAGAQIK